MEAKKVHGPPPAPPVQGDPSARRYYKIGEVCEMTDTQPYVLRFWESEFPQLAPRKSRAGQRIYEKRDVEMVIRIRKLLYDEEYTIAGARKKLEEEGLVAEPAAPPQGKRKGASLAIPAREKAPAAAERSLLGTLRALRKELQGVREMLGRRRP
jgi:DNA-binding transcriptional MerR regulator